MANQLIDEFVAAEYSAASQKGGFRCVFSPFFGVNFAAELRIQQIKMQRSHF